MNIEEAVKILGNTATTTETNKKAENVTKLTKSWKERNKVKLSLDRRFECIEKCISVLSQTDRNTLRRMGKVRAAHAALELKTALRASELNQLILESLDEKTGNSFKALSATERVTMARPEIQWEIPGLLPRGDLTFIGGRPKVGKTRITKHLVRSLLMAEDFLGFGAPPEQRTVILITDDQGDGDTAEMLQQLEIWDHPRLIWSRRFRVTQRNIDKLLACIAEHPGAVVVIDSLRSVTRSCGFDENSPEMGCLIYDLKTSVVDAGGTLVMVHHCNKSNDSIGTEALSGHNAIAGSGNTVVTLHYLSDGCKLLKKDPRRRFVREARSGAPADLVVQLDEQSGRYSKVADDYDDFTQNMATATDSEQLVDRIATGTAELQAALRYLQALFKSGNAPGAGLIDLAKIVGIADKSVRVTRDIKGTAQADYRKLGRHLDQFVGTILTKTEITDQNRYSMYALTAEGAELITKIYEF